MKKFKIFSSKSFLSENGRHAQLLFPFWGLVQKKWVGPQQKRFDNWVKVGSDCFELSDIENADLCVYPGEYGDWALMKQQAVAFAELAKKHKKPAALFFFADSAEPIEIENCLVFRTSLDRSTKASYEYVMPAWSEDFVEEYWDGKVVLREKQTTPVVGFCGQPGPFSLSQRAKSILRWAARRALKYIGSREKRAVIAKQDLEEGNYYGFHTSAIRSKALRVLMKSHRVVSNFQIFQGFYVLNSDEKQEQARQNMLNNILESDYILCVRGQGNFSYRLYETLCSGRIPVFIDTDSELPFEDQIDWRSIAVWVDQRDIERVGDKVAEFHDNLSPDEFNALQLKCRETWVEWLSPEGYFKKLKESLEAGKISM
ncbi:MAG: exostosin domain-containing protein [Pontibacterium sp.]